MTKNNCDYELCDSSDEEYVNKIKNELMECSDEEESSSESEYESDSENSKQVNEIIQESDDNSESENFSESGSSENDEDVNKTEEVEKDDYILINKSKTTFPCMSFDILNNNGEEKANFPISLSLVAGTYSASNFNFLILMKYNNLQSNLETDDLESENKNKKTSLKFLKIPHKGGINRVRTTLINKNSFCASWSESGFVYLWELSKANELISNDEINRINDISIKPLFSYEGHKQEGYAIDWSSLNEGVLATGDMNGKIHLWKPSSSNKWSIEKNDLSIHQGSVEDIQWCPNEQNILASCSIDKTIKVLDLRTSFNSSCMLNINDAHKSDVNVISWNKFDCKFLLSGGDDGELNVWDLRKFKGSDSLSPIASFSHHKKPITSVEWNPNDDSQFAASSEDNTITLWDLSCETNQIMSDELTEIDPQVMFIHKGQKEIKELHWYKQSPGVVVSTAINGFNIFKTANV